MKPHALLNIAVSLSLLGLTAIPAVAEELTIPKTQTVSQGTVIPQSAALIVVVPADVTLDAEKGQSYPIVLLTTQPIYDSNGNIIAPEKSRVNGSLKPTKQGIKIIAESVIIKGQIIPLQAESAVVPANTIKVASGIDKAKENSGAYSRFGASLVGAVGGGNLNGIKNGALVGSAVGILSGLTSSEKIQVVKIPQGSEYILTLQASVNLPPSLVANP
ncbi:hypothetical protein NIES4101_62860 [Calothrix sp. NIES-4101]|nr:hypothetical protein NIES4101_62860 [Calothrix sp. NIES-4101]